MTLIGYWRDLMEIKDLLDRFEILFPITSISNLRRSYTDKDLSSIFKLLDNEELRKAVIEENLHSIFRLFENCKINNTIDLEDLRKAIIEENLHSLFRIVENEDLRKAVIEKNLHSIFRISPNEDLRKLILEDNIWSLWKLLDAEITTQFVPALKFLISNNVNLDFDCLSQGQLKSKIWLIEELQKLDLNLGTVFLCAGWYATLATMIFENNLRVEKIRSFDIDSSCVDIAERFNKPWEIDSWKFKAVTKNNHEINYNRDFYEVKKPDGLAILNDSPDTIINTSCEHIDNFDTWYNSIPGNKLIILQTNNYFEIEDHVNCSASLEEFEFSTPMANCLYSGSLELPKYTRFMRIGYK
jgi:hypothetical protein